MNLGRVVKGVQFGNRMKCQSSQADTDLRGKWLLSPGRGDVCYPETPFIPQILGICSVPGSGENGRNPAGSQPMRVCKLVGRRAVSAGTCETVGRALGPWRYRAELPGEVGCRGVSSPEAATLLLGLGGITGVCRMEEVLARPSLKRVGRHRKGRCRPDCVKLYPLGSREPSNVIRQKSAGLRVVLLKSIVTVWRPSKQGRACCGVL